MKTKKLSKKLGLNKKTISNLNTHKMNEIKGGITNGCYSEDPEEHCPGTISKDSHETSYTPYNTLCQVCIP